MPRCTHIGSLRPAGVYETIDLMQADLTAGWVIGAAMGPLVVLQKSAAEYRNIEVGEEGFTGYNH
jgi:hypothetical protein